MKVQYFWITAPTINDNRWIFSLHTYDKDFEEITLHYIDNIITPYEIG